MKLVKLFALSSLIVASYSASEHSFASKSTSVDRLAGGCPTWPYCRDVEVPAEGEQVLMPSQMTEINVIAGGCPTWPYCRDVEIVDANLTASTDKLLVMAKAV
jgi:hypothetical protein